MQNRVKNDEAMQKCVSLSAIFLLLCYVLKSIQRKSIEQEQSERHFPAMTYPNTARLFKNQATLRNLSDL